MARGIPSFTFIMRLARQKEGKAKKIIEDAWKNIQSDVLKGCDKVWCSLGKWQYSRYNNRRCQINSLLKEIDSIVDMHGNYSNTERIRRACEELVGLYTFEVYWAQRSRIRWLCEGDKNTRFFHVHSTHRARKNHIDGMLDSDGRWTSDSRGICKVAQRHFMDLFMIECSNKAEQVLSLTPSCMTVDMNEVLMELRKTPGSDDLSGMFFKEILGVVGTNVLCYSNKMINSNRSIREVNDTIIVLIPKMAEPKDMIHYRPISLCRVIYK